MNKKLIIAAALVAVLVGLVVGLLLPSASTKLRGTSNLDSLSLSGNLNVSGTLAVTGEQSLQNCGTATAGIVALSPHNMTGAGVSLVSSSLTVTGAAVGDVTIVSFDPPSATGTLSAQGILATANIDAAGTASVSLFNASRVTSTAVGSGTLRVCYFD